MRLPSLRTIIMGASMPAFSRALAVALKKLSTTGSRRPLSSAVAPRAIILRPDDSSQPITNGTS